MVTTLDVPLGIGGATVYVFAPVSLILVECTNVPSTNTRNEPLIYFSAVEKLPVPALVEFSFKFVTE